MVSFFLQIQEGQSLTSTAESHGFPQEQEQEQNIHFTAVTPSPSCEGGQTLSSTAVSGAVFKRIEKQSQNASPTTADETFSTGSQDSKQTDGLPTVNEDNILSTTVRREKDVDSLTCTLSLSKAECSEDMTIYTQTQHKEPTEKDRTDSNPKTCMVDLVKSSSDPHAPIWLPGMDYPVQYCVRQTRSMSQSLYQCRDSVQPFPLPSSQRRRNHSNTKLSRKTSSISMKLAQETSLTGSGLEEGGNSYSGACKQNPKLQCEDVMLECDIVEDVTTSSVQWKRATVLGQCIRVSR